MLLNRMLLVWFVILLLTGIAAATEPDDVGDAIEDIDDALTAIDIAVDGNDMFQKQLDDPTNSTLLGENIKDLLSKPIEPLVGDIDNPDPEVVKNNVLGALYFGIAAYIFCLIAPLIMGLVTFVLSHI